MAQFRRKLHANEVSRASVIVFGQSHVAGVATYEQFVEVLHRALYEWRIPVGQINTTDQLDAATLAHVKRYCRENTTAKWRQFNGDWHSFGQAAESLRNRTMVKYTSHALAFAPQETSYDERLFTRLFREGVATKKM